MIKLLPGEVWQPVLFAGYKSLRNRYALSSWGRLASFKHHVEKDGKLLKGSITTGYRTLNLRQPGKTGTLYLHRELATLFLPKRAPGQKYVIHKNHNKLDNKINNLQWATHAEMTDHSQNSPAKLAYKKAQANRVIGQKLTVNQVRKIKSTLDNENRVLTIKQLADKYAVSEMTMYRIKSGENWARV